MFVKIRLLNFQKGFLNETQSLYRYKKILYPIYAYDLRPITNLGSDCGKFFASHYKQIVFSNDALFSVLICTEF